MKLFWYWGIGFAAAGAVGCVASLFSLAIALGNRLPGNIRNRYPYNVMDAMFHPSVLNATGKAARRVYWVAFAGMFVFSLCAVCLLFMGES